MLPRDQGGVVDANLRVYGLANVRIADASVVPIALSTHLMASTYGVAELAGEIIQTYYTTQMVSSTNNTSGSGSGSGSGSVSTAPSPVSSIALKASSAVNAQAVQTGDAIRSTYELSSVWVAIAMMIAAFVPGFDL